MGYVFDPEHLHSVARRAVGHQIADVFEVVTRELAHTYPGHVQTGPRHWIFNNAGGAMGQIALLHASLSEYVLFFGTPLGTSGHSGRYATHVWDFMLAGEMWCYGEGDAERSVYRPGDAAYLGPSQVKGYRLPEGAWMLEYARGPIPTMLPFGVADTVTSTLDVTTLSRTFWHYGKLVTRELVRGKI